MSDKSSPSALLLCLSLSVSGRDNEILVLRVHFNELWRKKQNWEQRNNMACVSIIMKERQKESRRPRAPPVAAPFLYEKKEKLFCHVRTTLLRFRFIGKDFAGKMGI